MARIDELAQSAENDTQEQLSDIMMDAAGRSPDEFADQIETVDYLAGSDPAADVVYSPRDVAADPDSYEALRRLKKRNQFLDEAKGYGDLQRGILRDPDIAPLVVDDASAVNRMLAAARTPERAQFLIEEEQFNDRNFFDRHATNVAGMATNMWTSMLVTEMYVSLLAGKTPLESSRLQAVANRDSTAIGGRLWVPEDPTDTGFWGGFDIGREVPRAIVSSSPVLAAGGVGAGLGSGFGPLGTAIGGGVGMFAGSFMLALGEQMPAVVLDDDFRVRLTDEQMPEALGMLAVTSAISAAFETTPGLADKSGLGMLAKGAKRKLLARALKQMSAKTVAKQSGAARLAGSFVLSPAGEGITELMQESVNVIAETYGKMIEGKIERTWEAFYDDALRPENLDRILYAAGAGTAGGGMGVPVTAARTVIESAAQVQRVTDIENSFKDLSKTVGETKLHKRAPAKLRDLLLQTLEGTSTDTTYVKGSTFLEQLVDNDDPVAQQILTNLREQLPDLDQQIELARTDVDVAMPTAVFAAYLAATEAFDGLSGSLKFDPNDLTVDERNEIESASEAARFQRMLERESQDSPDDVATAERMAAEVDQEQAQAAREREALVRQDLERLIARDGRLPVSASKQYAHALARAIARLAASQGRDPWSLYLGQDLRVTRQQIEAFQAEERANALETQDFSTVLRQEDGEAAAEPSGSEAGTGDSVASDGAPEGVAESPSRSSTSGVGEGAASTAESEVSGASSQEAEPGSQTSTSLFPVSLTTSPLSHLISSSLSVLASSASVERGEFGLVGMIGKVYQKLVMQPTIDLDALLAHHAERESYHTAHLQRAAVASGTRLMAHRLKVDLNGPIPVEQSKARINQKLTGVNKKTGEKVQLKNVDQLSDYYGARMVVESMQQLEDLVAALQLDGFVFIEFDDFLTSPRDVGHAALHAQLMDTATGLSFEVQISTNEMFYVVEAGHKLYEEYRLDTTSEERKQELFEQMKTNFSKVSPSVVPFVVEPISPRVLDQEGVMKDVIRAHDREWKDYQPPKYKGGKRANRYKGLPADSNTPAGYRKLLNRVKSMALNEGASGRMWYEKSARWAYIVAKGDPREAEMLIELLAIYSPGSEVFVNTQFAFRAYSQWKTGKDVADWTQVSTEQRDDKAKAILYEGADWTSVSTPKTESFFHNLILPLMRSLSENERAQLKTDATKLLDASVTIDIWVMRAMGFDVDTPGGGRGAGSSRYAVVEGLFKRAVAEMNEGLSDNDQLWEAHQLQAAMWTAIQTRANLPMVKEKTVKQSLKAGHISEDESGNVVYAPEGSKAYAEHHKIWVKNALAVKDSGLVRDVAERKGFDFSEAMQRLTNVIPWEALPSKHIAPDLLNKSYLHRKAFTNAAKWVILKHDTGKDMIADKLGIDLYYQLGLTGGYDGLTNPNNVLGLLPYKPRGDFFYEQIDLYARMLQYIYMQDAVPFYRLDSRLAEKADEYIIRDKETGKARNGTRMTGQRNAEALFRILNSEVLLDENLKPILYTTNGKNFKKGDPRPNKNFDKYELVQSVLHDKGKEPKPGSKSETRTRKDPRGVEITAQAVFEFKGGAVDPLLEEEFETALVEVFGDGGYSQMVPGMMVVGNYTSFDGDGVFNVTIDEFYEKADAFIEKYGERFGLKSYKQAFSEGKYGYYQDWRTDPEGENLLTDEANPLSQRPDLHDWLRGRREAFRKISEQWEGEGDVGRQLEDEARVGQAEVDAASTTEGPQIFLQRDAPDTPNFKAFSNGTRVVSKPQMGKFKTGEPVTLGLWHGTTHERERLSNIQVETTNRQNFVGQAFYASSFRPDATDNYGNPTTSGDLNNRIQQSQERIEASLENFDIQEVKEIYEREIDGRTEVLSLEELEKLFPGEDAFISNVAHQLARFRHLGSLGVQGRGETHEVWMRITNPFVMDGSQNSKESEWLNYVEDVINEDGESDMEFNDAGFKLLDALEDVGDKYLDEFEAEGTDPLELISTVREKILEQGGEITTKELHRAIMEVVNPIYDLDGTDWLGGQIFSDVLKALGHDGMILTNAEDEFVGMANMSAGTVHGMSFDNTSVKSAENTEFSASNRFYRHTDSAENSVVGRGFYRPHNGLDAVIGLTSDMNMSTFLHESAHFMLDLMFREATGPDATAETLQNWAEIKQWLRISDGQTELTERQQETFAESMELYLREGKPPHESLRPAFRKFKMWLLDIYKSVSQRPLGQINDEVRAIFDNLYAGDLRADKAMESQAAAEPVLLEKPEGWTDAKWNAYLSRVKRVRGALGDRIQTNELSKLRREQSKEVKSAMASMRDIVRADFVERAATRARHWLRTGALYNEEESVGIPHKKLSRETVELMLPDGGADTFPTGVIAAKGAPALTEEETMQLAMSLGFEDVSQMINELTSLGRESDTKLINIEADERLRSEQPELFKTDLELEEEAADFVASDQGQKQLLAWQIKELRKLAKQAPEAEQAEKLALPVDPEAEVSDAREALDRLLTEGGTAEEQQLAAVNLRLAEEQARVARRQKSEKRTSKSRQRDASSYIDPKLLKSQARQFVGTIPASQLQSIIARFRATAKRAAREAVMHAAQGEHTMAAIELERQLLAMEVIDAAAAYQKQVDKGFRKAKTFNGNKLKKFRKHEQSRDLLEQILSIYQRINLRASAPGLQPNQRRALTDVVNEYIESYGMVWPGPEFLDTGEKKNWKQMPVQELIDTFAAVNSLEQWAKVLTDAMNEKLAVERRAKRDRLIDSAAKNTKGGQNPQDSTGPLGALQTKLREWGNELRITQFMFDRLDGGVIGPWNEYVWEPVKRAANWARERAQLEAKNMEALYSEHYTVAELKQMRGPFAPKYKVGSRMLNKAEVIGVALHWGNEGGRKAIMEAEEGSISEQEVTDALEAHLTDADKDFLEATWAYLNGFRQEVGKLVQRTTGTTPQWVDAVPFSVGGRLMTGGYYPLHYDRDHSKPNVGQREDKQDAKSVFPNAASQAHTAQGHTKARVGSGGAAPKLDFTQTLSVHIHNVITDLAYREVVTDVSVLVRNDAATMRAMRDAIGPEADGLLAGWLERQVSPKYLARTVTESAMDKITQASALSILGASLATAAINVTGMIPAIGMVKGHHLLLNYHKLFTGSRLLAGTTDAGGWGGLMQGLAAIRESSAEMRKRFNTFDATVAEANRRLVGPGAGQFTRLQRMSMQAAFGIYGVIDQLVAGGVWITAYEEAMSGQKTDLNVPGQNHDRAVAWADKVVQKTQGDGAIESIAKVQEKNNPFLRLVTVFITYCLTMFNLHAEKLHAARIDPNKHAAGYAQWMFIMLFVMPLVEGTMRAAVKSMDPGEDDEFEELLTYNAINAATFSNPIVGGVPIVRDFTSALSPLIRGQSPYDVQFSPSSATLESATKAIYELSKGTDADLTKAATLSVEAIGPWFKVPTPHMVRFVEMITQEELK